MVNRRNKKIIKNLSDYIVPIFLVLIIIVVIVSFIFSGGDKTEKRDVEISGINIVSSSNDFNANIVYSGGRTSSASVGNEIHIGEKIDVRTGYIDISLPGNVADIRINRLGEVLYSGSNNLTHYSSDLWVNAKSDLTIDMRFAKVKTPRGIFSLAQNEVASTIYVLSGEVEVSNLAGMSGVLKGGQTVTIMRNSSNDTDINIDSLINDIPENILTDDWFTLNSGTISIESGSNQSNEELSTSNNDRFSFISFNNINDESEVLRDTLDIEGTILHERVGRVDINGITGDIDEQNSSFTFPGFRLTNRVNDLVYKVYDDDGNNLSKGVITLYYRGGTNNTTQSSGLAGVSNFIFGTSPNYPILSPTTNPFETSESVVRIEGQVPVGTVERITVNDFQLTQFPRRGTYWQYFANTQYGNLKDGLNLYHIKYFGQNDELLYENTFVIIKK